MLIFPAIDLMNGRCVRLKQGRADQMTIYNDDPVAQALEWEAQGGGYLHLVDLDGAFAGEPRHTAIIAAIAKSIKIPVEIGGGLRNDDHVAELIETGVRRVILGTRAVAEPTALRRLVELHGDRIAVGIDAREGLVQVKGWVETTTKQASELAREMADIGVSTIIYTDTATDGMLTGPNIPGMAAMCDAVPDVKIVASGGISVEDDVRRLAALNRDNLEGVIVGKALYEGAVTMPGLIAAATT